MWRPILWSSQAGESAWYSGEGCPAAVVGLTDLNCTLVQQPGRQDTFASSNLKQPGRPPSVQVLPFATFEGQAQRSQGGTPEQGSCNDASHGKPRGPGRHMQLVGSCTTPTC